MLLCLMITNINQLDFSKQYRYSDYLTWAFDDSVELIHGRIFHRLLTPGTLHQSSSSDLHVIIGSYLRGKTCKVFSAPFDVRLSLPAGQQSADNIDTVVQPDISIICDLSKLDERGCQGAPDWIIEILSKSTAQKDLNEKFNLYQHAGVREYWIVHPNEGTVLPFRLNATGTYEPLRPNPFTSPEAVPVGIFPGFAVDLKEVFG